MIQLFKTKIHEEAIRNVEEVLRSGWVGLGPKVEEFEKKFAEYIGAPYAVAFSSATAALHVAVRLLNLRPGADVITTPLTFVSSNHVLLYENLTPIFADIDIQTGNLSLDSIRKACRLHTIPKVIDKTFHPRVLMFVHYGGNVGDLDLLYEIAQEYKLTIIEDCAHAAGAMYCRHHSDHQERVGARAKLACFSFHAVKNMPTGDGGMLTTTDEEFAHRAKTLRWLGVDKSTADRTGPTYGWRYDVKEVGFKSYMNDITAALGLGQLPHLDTDNTLRVGIYETYKNAGLPMLPSKPGYAHHLAVMLAETAEQKEKIQKSLTEDNIQHGCHYLPNYYYSMYKDNIRIDGCHNTEDFYNRCISLPNHLYLQPEDLMQVVDTVKEVV
jgi:perosamine synthetase